jgi:hypothetical protein
MPVSATMLPYLLRSASVSARTTILRSAPGYSRPPDYSSSVGIAVWAVMPNFAHTYFWEKRNLERGNFVVRFLRSQRGPELFQRHHLSLGWQGFAELCQKEAWRRCDPIQPHADYRRKRSASDALNGFAGWAWACRPNCPLFAKREKPGVSFQLAGSTKFESRTC